MLNQRWLLEWIEIVNTLISPVPCYSSGIRGIHVLATIEL